jgi:hypothetical protein
MASTIRWFGGAGTPEIAPAASGGFNTLGFFGASFGFSIRVGEYNTTSFRTNSNGTSNGSQLPNVKFANSSGAFVGASLVAEELLEVENALATLNIRLNTDNVIKTQNSRFRAFDRININNNPSGVYIAAAEIEKDQASVRGSGDAFWTQIFGSGSVLALSDQTTANFNQHDWYVALTASPLTIGEKTEIGFYFETEFL